MPTLAVCTVRFSRTWFQCSSSQPGYFIILIVLTAAIGIPTRDGLAQTDDVQEYSVNYAYASWVGTGYYRIDDRRIYILRGPFSYTFR
jgi:hypothetical protein